MEIIFVGALIVTIGAFVSAWGTLKQNRSSSAKSDKQLQKIDDLNNQNNLLSVSLTELSKQNSELALQLGALGEQNGKLMLELSSARNDVDKARQEAHDNTFGSKNAIFVPGSSFHGKIFNESDLPVYDLRIFVTDYMGLLKCAVLKDKYGHVAVQKSCYENYTKPYTVGLLYGQTVVDLLDAKIEKDTPTKTLVKFITKKGTYYQQFINVPILGTAFRILEPIDEGSNWKQYMNPNVGEDFKPVPLQYKITREHSTFENPVDWDKEFPLPPSVMLVD
jgi:hypothetical protein